MMQNLIINNTTIKWGCLDELELKLNSSQLELGLTHEIYNLKMSPKDDGLSAVYSFVHVTLLVFSNTK